MGDTVLTLPALRLLRQAYPRARFAYVTSPMSEELLRGFTEIDKLLVFRKEEVWLPWKLRRFLVALRRPRPDVAIVLGTVSFSTTSALLAWSSGARFRAGVSSLPFGSELSRALYHLELPLGPPEVHEVEHNAAPLRGLGIHGVVEFPQLAPLPAAHEEAKEFVDKNFPDRAGPLVVVHPGAGKKENVWPVDRFAEVARQLATQESARLLACEGPRDAAAVAEFLALCPGAVRWRASLTATLGLLSRTDLFLGNDTGMAHVAAACGAPTLAVFGPTDPKRWSPAGPSVHCIRSPTGRVADARIEDVLSVAIAMLRSSVRSGANTATPLRSSTSLTASDRLR